VTAIVALLSAASAPAMRSSHSDQPPRVQSVARAADILYVVATSSHGLAPREISDQTGLPRQTVYHLVHTLVAARLLRRGEGNRLTLGLGVGALADAFQRQVAPHDHLRPLVEALAAETGELAYASGWRDGEIVVVAVARGANVIQAREVTVGNTEDGHSRASGKLLLAHVSEAERAEYLRTHSLRRRTPRTITGRSALVRELDTIRDQGFAVDDEEYAEGLCCLAVPLEPAHYALGLAAPADRFRARWSEYLANARAVAGRG
jgi:DNA-binding IclR family transcriptional regulator